MHARTHAHARGLGLPLRSLQAHSIWVVRILDFSIFFKPIWPGSTLSSLRGAQHLGCATHWVFAAALTYAFPIIVTKFSPGAVFLFFCGMMVLQLIWVKLMVPETKGVPLEEMQKKLGVAP